MAKAKKQPVKSRRLKTPKYQSFRVSRRIKNPHPKLPSGIKLFITSWKAIKSNWRLFIGISLVYGLLTLVLVRGLSSGTNIQDLKDALSDTFSGSFGGLTTSAVLFSYLIGSTNDSPTPAGGVYQTILLLITSLASIWALRQILAGNKIKAKDAFYKGLYPLAPFMLVLLTIGLQLIPLLLGSWIYGTVIANGIAVSVLEKVMWGALFFSTATLSFYMICSSIFALYIVTLPDMTPLKALRSARQLVLHRRWVVLRKVLFLPLILLVLAALIFMPLVIVWAAGVEWIFFAMSMFLVIIIHSYMYNLYRALL